MPKRLGLDLLMMIALLVGLAFQWTGDFIHEIVGFVFVGLFMFHFIWNKWWYLMVFKGDFPKKNIMGNTINVALIVTLIAMSVSGFLQSDIIADAVGVKLDHSMGKIPLFNMPLRDLHALTSYWVFVLSAFHLGVHWSVVMKHVSKWSGFVFSGRIRTPLMRGLTCLIAVYGLYFFDDRQLAAKLSAYFSFDFWDFRNNTLGFFAGYTAVIGLYVTSAYSLTRLLRKARKGGSARRVLRNRQA